MPWQSPTLEQIAERIRADMRARLPGARPELRRSLLGVLAQMEAGAVQGLHGYLDWLARQLMIDTAEAEHLERWAAVWGVDRATPVAASGSIIATGNEGSEIPEGAQLESDSGETYATDSLATIDASGQTVVAVTAVEPGSAGNLDAAETLRFVSAISGIDSEATVGAEGLSGGADRENDQRLRERLLNRIQQPANGGSRQDYARWTLEAHPDVTRAWVYPLESGIGTVTVRAVCDGLADIIPSVEVLEAIESYLDEQRPVTADVFVVAPVAVPLDLSIQLTPDTTDARQRIETALRDFLATAAQPGGTIYREQLSGVIYIAAGESRHTLQVPVADVEHAVNEIAVLGAITWL
jgi:uncharacterized phage protein gp47/JayE